MLIYQVVYLSHISFQSHESVFGKKREHFHKRNALLRTPHPLREHYRKLLMPTPIRSELRSLRHSRNSDVVFQEDAKNYRLFIPKRSNSERKDSNFSFIQSIPNRKNAHFNQILSDFSIFGHRIWSFLFNFAFVNAKNMRRDLGFLKVSDYSQPFRLTRGHDDELNLSRDEIIDVTTGPGVYIIVSADNTKFVYPKGTSPVIYIGKADNLRRRLTEHLKNLDSIRDDETYMRGHWHQPCSRYQYMKYYGAYVYTFHCLKNSQDAKNLESQILWKFYERYRSLPVGNGARSFRKE